MFEKKRGKRFLASVMALIMLLSLAPVGALAVDDGAQNQDVVTLPADGDNPKPVETGTANTNEETTPPPQMRVLQYYLPITTMSPWRSPKRP